VAYDLLRGSGWGGDNRNRTDGGSVKRLITLWLSLIPACCLYAQTVPQTSVRGLAYNTNTLALIYHDSASDTDNVIFWQANSNGVWAAVSNRVDVDYLWSTMSNTVASFVSNQVVLVDLQDVLNAGNTATGGMQVTGGDIIFGSGGQTTTTKIQNVTWLAHDVHIDGSVWAGEWFEALTLNCDELIVNGINYGDLPNDAASGVSAYDWVTANGGNVVMSTNSPAGAGYVPVSSDGTRSNCYWRAWPDETGIWGMDTAASLVLLDPVVRTPAGYWKMNASGEIELRSSPAGDAFWTTNAAGEVVTRDVL